MKTSKSTLSLARHAVGAAERTLPAYSAKKSPHKFTQPQLVACLAVRQSLGLDYRGLSTLLAEWAELRRTIGLQIVPHFTTLQKASQRLEKKTSSSVSSPKS